ncbi:MAG: ferritin family protein [Acetobacteraceae bacterium]
MDSTLVAAADHAARNWRFGGSAPAGGDRHKAMFSRMLLDTFNPYKPAVIDWPVLESPARERLIALPIWDIAVQTEGRARLRIRSYARRLSDPLLREAFELMAFEEGRHKEVLSNLVTAYGIQLEPEPEYVEPRDPEWGFMVTGYSECIDSFFAFGLFEVAKRSGFFPPALVETFEPVIQEEGRHILFFVNWVAWHKRTMPLWRRPWFFLKTLAVWAFLIRERIGLAKDVSAGEKENANFTVQGAGAVGNDIAPAELMRLCLAENDRRLVGYDPRLLRPRTVPRLVQFALRFMGRRRR